MHCSGSVIHYSKQDHMISYRHEWKAKFHPKEKESTLTKKTGTGSVQLKRFGIKKIETLKKKLVGTTFYAKLTKVLTVLFAFPSLDLKKILIQYIHLQLGNVVNQKIQVYLLEDTCADKVC